VIKSDDFLLQLLWIRDYNSGLDISFWPFVFLSNEFLKFQLQNQALLYLAFSSSLVMILYCLISLIDKRALLTRFVRLGLSSALFLILTYDLSVRYYSFPTYQFLSLLVAITSCLIFLKAQKHCTNFYIVTFAFLTLFALFTRFTQAPFVIVAFTAALLASAKQGGLQPRVAIARYVLASLTMLAVFCFANGRQIENLLNFVSDSFAFSSMPIERPITNILYTSFVTVFPLSHTMLKVRQKFITCAAISIIIGYNFFYFQYHSGFFKNVTIALVYLILAIRLNPSLQVLKNALPLNVLLASFLFGSYNAIRDFPSTQLGLLSFTILYYYLARHDDKSIPLPKQIFLLLSRALTVISLTFLLLAINNINSNESLRPFDSVSLEKQRDDSLFIDLTGRQDAWPLALENRWGIFPYVIPAIFPSNYVADQRTLAITNDKLEKRVSRVINILNRFDKVTRFKILVEAEYSDKDREYVLSDYSSSLLTLFGLNTKICQTGEKFNEKSLPERTLIIEACS